MAQDKDLFSSEDLPEEGSPGGSAVPPPPPPDEDLPPPPGELFKSSDAPEEAPAHVKLGEFPKVELPTWPPVSDAPSSPFATESSTAEPQIPSTPPPPADSESSGVSPSPFGEAAPAETAASEPVAGAHLSLPSIDFSMPSFDIGASTSSTPAHAAPAGGDLPAHLNLPSFPEFELPPIPGQEKKVSIEGMPGGSFGIDEPGAAPAATSATSPDQWQVQAPSGGPPPPPPRRKKKAEGLPDLPQMALPEIAAKRRPELLHSSAAIDVGSDGIKGRLRFSKLVLWLALAAVAAALVAVVKFTPAGIIAYFNPEVTKEIELSAAQKAEKSFLEGFEVYKLAEEAEKEKSIKEAQRKFKQAISLFQKAVAFDPSMDKAHRSLGITFAKVKDNDKAVGHYRKYLELAPNAPDAAKVRKFVGDYEAAQKGKRKR